MAREWVGVGVQLRMCGTDCIALFALTGIRMFRESDVVCNRFRFPCSHFFVLRFEESRNGISSGGQTRASERAVNDMHTQVKLMD